MLYFSRDSMDLSKTFRLCMWVFTQHKLQILLKYLIYYFRYSSLNFKVHFFKWTCSCTLNMHEQQIQFLIVFHQQLKCFNHECQMPVAHSVFKQADHNVSAHQLQQHMIEICCKMIQISYQWTREANHSALSTKRSFISALRWPALSCVFDSVPAQYFTHDNPLAHLYGAFSVTITSKLQFSYWFTLKTALLSSIDCKF